VLTQQLNNYGKQGTICKHSRHQEEVYH